MIEQNNNNQPVFNKEDAKKALKTLTTFGLQQGTKFANVAGEKMTDWSKKLGAKMDAVKKAQKQDGDRFGDKPSFDDLSEFVNHAANEEELGLALATTTYDMPNGFTPDVILDSENEDALLGLETDALRLGDLNFRLVHLSAGVKSVDLLELVPEDGTADPADNGVIILTGMMSYVLQSMFFKVPPMKQLSEDEFKMYAKTPVNFGW